VLSRVSNTTFNCNNLMLSCCCMPGKSGVACDACLMLCFSFSFFSLYLSFLVIAAFLFLSSIMHIISPLLSLSIENGEVQKNTKVTNKIELHTLCLRANSSSWFLKVASCSFIRSVRILATFSPRDRYWSRAAAAVCRPEIPGRLLIVISLRQNLLLARNTRGSKCNDNKSRIQLKS
jgi:hypothetical protein